MSAGARLESLTLRSFRNFDRLELDVPAGGLVLVGENGQGKTNLLEAIYYLGLLRSGRDTRDQDLVRFGAEGFFVSGRFEAPAGAGGGRDGPHEVSVGFDRASRRKRVRVDGIEQRRLADALGSLPSVMFSPQDVELIAGGPAARRRFLDIVLSLANRSYLRALQRYRAALARRNAALRAAGRGAHGREAIAIWEPALAEYGAVLVRQRRDWVAASADVFQSLCCAIGETAVVTFRYASADGDGGSDAERLAAGLEQKRELDLRHGITHVGPHRDDLSVTVTGADGLPRPLRAFGSAGQQRTAAIALRMLEAATLRDGRGGSPVFLLDDPFAELDFRRSTRIMHLLSDAGLGQTILAVPGEYDIPVGLERLERRVIVAGTVSGRSASDADR